MYAKIALMGFDVGYGRVISSQFPGLIKVEPFHKLGDHARAYHVGPGAVFKIQEMSKEEAAEAWCADKGIMFDDVVHGTGIVWIPRCSLPPGMKPSCVNGHHFPEGQYECSNSDCRANRDEAFRVTCPAFTLSAPTPSEPVPEPVPESDDSKATFPEANINGHHFKEGERCCDHEKCVVRRVDAETWNCPDDGVPF